MLACEVAFTLFRTPTKIARIRAAEYTSRSRAVRRRGAGGGRIHQSRAAGHRVHRAAHQLSRARCRCWTSPTARCDWSACARGEGGNLVGHALRELPRASSQAPRCASSRSTATAGRCAPKARRSSRTATRCSSSPARDDIRRVMTEMRNGDDPVRRVVIAGGGNIGFRLAQDAGETQPGEAHRARRAARAPQDLGAARKRHRAARRRGGRGTADRGEHRQHRRVRGPDQLGRGQHPLGDAGQAPGRAQGHGAHQQALLHGADGERQPSTSPSRRRPSPSARCWRTCGAATWCGCTRCARGSAEALEAIVHGDERSSRVVGPHGRRRSSYPKGPPSARSCAATRSSWRTTTPSCRPMTTSSCSWPTAATSRRSSGCSCARRARRGLKRRAAGRKCPRAGCSQPSALACLLPVGCSLLMGDGQWPHFLLAAALDLGAGLAARWRHHATSGGN